jgi:hypothetical protein
MYLVEPFGDRPFASLLRVDIAGALDEVQAKGFAIGANRMRKKSARPWTHADQLPANTYGLFNTIDEAKEALEVGRF